MHVSAYCREGSCAPCPFSHLPYILVQYFTFKTIIFIINHMSTLIFRNRSSYELLLGKPPDQLTVCFQLSMFFSFLFLPPSQFRFPFLFVCLHRLFALIQQLRCLDRIFILSNYLFVISLRRNQFFLLSSYVSPLWVFDPIHFSSKFYWWKNNGLPSTSHYLPFLNKKMEFPSHKVSKLIKKARRELEEVECSP